MFMPSCKTSSRDLVCFLKYRNYPELSFINTVDGIQLHNLE